MGRLTTARWNNGQRFLKRFGLPAAPRNGGRALQEGIHRHEPKAVAIVPRSLAPLRTPLRFVRLRGKAPEWNVSLVGPERMALSAAGRAFFDLVAGGDAAALERG